MTPETLTRHELAGLAVEVVDSPNPDLVGIAGRVVDETQKTLLVAAGEGVKQVPKAAATLRFELEDATVEVDGEVLLARPARRTERKRGSLWQ